MKNEKILEKTPLELTDEELLELTNQIARIEYNRKPHIKMFQDPEDTAHEVLCYAYEKSAKNKVGINEIKEKSMKHFTNTLHMEVRNNINYVTRKKKTQQFLFNTLSLEQDINPNSEGGDRLLRETIPDEAEIRRTEDNIDLDYILSQIDNTDDETLVIKYGVGHKNFISKFNFRNLAKLYLDLFEGKKVNYKDFEGILYKSSSNEPLELSQIKIVIDRFKKYMKEENILGGAF